VFCSRSLPSFTSRIPSALYSASVPSGRLRLRFRRSSWIIPPRSIPSLAFPSSIRIAAILSRGPNSSSWAISTSVWIMSRTVHSLTLNARPISPGTKNEARFSSPPRARSWFSVFVSSVFNLGPYLPIPVLGTLGISYASSQMPPARAYPQTQRGPHRGYTLPPTRTPDL
jgi:hypothetical protein